MPQPTSVPTNPTVVTALETEKGCVHWYDFNNNSDPNAIKKIRPCIIIARSNPKSHRVIISPITDLTGYVEHGKLKYPYHAPLLVADHPFLDKDSVILLDQTYTIEKQRLYQEWYMGKVNDTSEIDKAIIYNYDLYEAIYTELRDLLTQFEPLHKTKFSRK
ncbi:MAG: type II toxin-antitoxin system PemK/MazF family toxin [Candidatus Pristimantibacillus sp.]